MKFSGHLTRDAFDRYDTTSGKDVLDAGGHLAAYVKKTGIKRGHPCTKMQQRICQCIDFSTCSGIV